MYNNRHLPYHVKMGIGRRYPEISAPLDTSHSKAAARPTKKTHKTFIEASHEQRVNQGPAAQIGLHDFDASVIEMGICGRPDRAMYESKQRSSTRLRINLSGNF